MTKQLGKYFRVAALTWEEMLTYRFNFAMWRVRGVLTILTRYYIWLAAIPVGMTLFGYSQKTILTYVIGTAILEAIVFSSRAAEIGDDINSGNLSQFLLRPMNYFGYWFSRDMGDKAMNIVFCAGEVLILYFLLRPPLFAQTDMLVVVAFLLAVILATILYFSFSVLLGMIGFWSPEIWAPRFIFIILVNALSGGLFPLTMMPPSLYRLFQLSPFPYLMFFPLNIYLGKVPREQILLGFVVCIFWIGVMYWFVLRAWKKGIKQYTAYGN